MMQWIYIVLLGSFLTGTVQAQSGAEGVDFPPLPADRIDDLSRYKNLPLRVDNSLQPYFPPVIDQLGWSCNQASSVWYVLSYELNRKRELDGSLPENQMSPAFPYNILMSESSTTGVSYFDTWEIIKVHGCANVVDFPYTNNHQIWMNGFDKYLRAIKNKVINNFSLSVATANDLRILKSWLFNHNDSFRFGGLANLQIASTGMRLHVLPDGSYDAGASVITGFGTAVGHALTVVGFNDEVAYDFNHDGLLTNNLDLNNDGVVDMADWEVGALVVVNSWGKNWGDRGKAYLPYRLLTKFGHEGGIWNRSVHVVDVVHDYDPQLVAKISILHSHRSMVKVSIGCSNDPLAELPEYVEEFPILSYHGGEGSLGSFGEDNHMEMALDITPLLKYLVSGQVVKFFLMVHEKDPLDLGSGMVSGFEVIHYADDGEVTAVHPGEVVLKNNQTTIMGVEQSLDFERLSVAAYETQYTDPNQWLSIPLQAMGSSGGNQWEIVPDYREDSLIRDFPALEGDYLPFYTGNEGFLNLPLPFDFPFYGENFSTLYADEDGNLYFETNFLDYPYSIDKDLVFKQRKNIVPFGGNLIFSVQGGGLYYQPTDSVARIIYECQALLGQSVKPYRFACNLYPDGLIEFHYSDLNLDQPKRVNYRSGLSRGNGNQTLITTSSRLGYLVPNQVVRLIPYRIPPKTKIESNSYLLTRPEEVNQLFEIRVGVTDNQARSAYGVIPVSTLDFSSPDIEASAFPNPFSQYSTISFILSEKSTARVAVYDLHGKFISELWNSELDKGQQEVRWNGLSDGGGWVSPGVYLVSIVAGDVRQQVKIIKNAW